MSKFWASMFFLYFTVYRIRIYNNVSAFACLSRTPYDSLRYVIGLVLSITS